MSKHKHAHRSTRAQRTALAVALPAITATVAALPAHSATAATPRTPDGVASPIPDLPARPALSWHERHILHLDHLAHLAALRTYRYQAPARWHSDGDRDSDDGYTAVDPGGRTVVIRTGPVSVLNGVYGYGALERLWTSAGGNPRFAAVAACIATHESGGRPGAISPTNDYGLWQEHNDPAALNPFTSAVTAVVMSRNGTDWSPWTTAPMCGV